MVFTGYMTAENNPIRLSEVLDDRAAISRFLEEDDITEYLSESNSYDSSVRTRIELLLVSYDQPVGFARIDSIRWTNRKASLTIYLTPENRGRGYGKAALALLIDYGFNKLQFHRLEGEVYEYNLASIKLMDQFGFKLEGRLRQAKNHRGTYHDILVYGLLAEEYPPSGRPA